MFSALLKRKLYKKILLHLISKNNILKLLKIYKNYLMLEPPELAIIKINK